MHDSLACFVGLDTGADAADTRHQREQVRVEHKEEDRGTQREELGDILAIDALGEVVEAFDHGLDHILEPARDQLHVARTKDDREQQ